MKCFRLVLLLLLFSGFVSESIAQCGPADFTIPEQICLNQNMLVQADNTADSIEWDFCSADFTGIPTATPAFQIGSAVGRPGMDLVKKNGTWFGFVTGTWTNSLQVLTFGDGLREQPTQITALGNLNGMLNNPGSIRVIEEQGNWYGIIHNTGSSEILKVTFGASFTDIADVVVLISGVGYINSGLAIGRDAIEGWTLVVSEPDNTFSVIRLGNDLHPPSSEDVIETSVVPNPNNLGDVDLIEVCGEWFGSAVNLGGGNTYLLRFGTSLFSNPQIDEIAALPVSNGARLRFANEGSEFFLFVASLDGLWELLKFGESINTDPDVEHQGDLNGSLPSQAYAVALAKENSDWTIFCTAQDNGQVYRLSYPLSCAAFPATSHEKSAVVQFETSGTHTISMKSFAGGQIARASKTITVTEDRAPDINFVTENICSGHDVFFSSVNLSDDIETYLWHFGDMATSSEENPVHQYMQGSYEITLEVVAANGCTNKAFADISIFPAPQADFSLPSDILCTNNQVSAPTLTPDIYDGNLNYQWFVDGIAAGTDRDLQYTFTTTGPKDIKLVTSIPGCTSEITKTTPSVESGPLVDFSFAGVCEDDNFSFSNLTTDPVTGYLWDFGNGNTSASTDAQHAFGDYGDYAVSLTATNAVGCKNITTKTVKVHARPVAGFLASGPPNSCSGAPTQLLDQSSSPDGNPITQWLWDLGEASSDDTKDPIHTFSASGHYNVSLTVTTSAGCSSNVIQSVDIYQSPSIDFSFSPICDDVPAVFTPPADNSIVDWYWEIGTSYYTTSSPSHTFKSPGNYPVYLEVTASNGCESSRHEVINVPIPLNPDFSYLKNCVGQEAVLTDVTTGSDPVFSRDWTFDSGEAFSGSSINFVFDKEQTKTVTMKVTAASGCSYSVSKQIAILPPPVAGFTADPASGAYPLEVMFTNTSSGATHYFWNFNDGSDAVSTDVSPVHTFDDVGSYDVELIAFNSQECESNFLSNIPIVAPLPDADIENIALTPNADGSLKLIVTIHNKGNTILSNLPLDLDFSGVLNFRQMLEDRIDPGAKFNFIFSTGIVNKGELRYVCASADVAGDLSPAGNRMCKELKEGVDVFQAFPNPVSDVLNIEWVQSGQKTVRLSLIDTMGRIVFDTSLTGSDGLNRRALVLDAVKSGIYYLVIRQEGAVTTQKVAVSTRL